MPGIAMTIGATADLTLIPTSADLAVLDGTIADPVRRYLNNRALPTTVRQGTVMYDSAG